VEKCGKVWRRENETAARDERLGEVYSMSGSGAKELRACSACAGDYEDPDRTAWTPDEPDDEGRDEAPSATTEEFPAEE
jgi:hypothetical protein